MDINHKEYEKVYFSEKFSFNGLNSNKVDYFRQKYGSNTLGEAKKKSIILKIFKALSEPMILILLFACIITLGINIGNLLAGAQTDFYECLGIIGAVFLSVGLTVYMENKSERAFEQLKKFSDNTLVTVVREGEKKMVNYGEVVVGDLLICESGEKIIADALIIECNEAETEESTLSGESLPIRKQAYKNGNFTNENMLYSGTYLKSGNAKAIVLSVGQSAQIGKIASTLASENSTIAPLSQKLNQLSKNISIFGGVAAGISFILTLLRLYTINSLTFENAREAFIEAVVLIVAAVPEGLPATVAIALSLSMVRLAKSNAVIKKLLAAETVGCVSVICSDKTGTLTEGKMQVSKYVVCGMEVLPKKLNNDAIMQNIVHNSTAYLTYEKKQVKAVGNSTEQALLFSLFKSDYKCVEKMRAKARIALREPFSSKRKYMQTQLIVNGERVTYLKGAVESVIEQCNLSENERLTVKNQADIYAKYGDRIIAFAHKNGDQLWIFDGFCVISDQIRAEVYGAVKECKKAGISIKILTGDNLETATAIAKKLNLLGQNQLVLSGKEVDLMSDEQLKEQVSKIAVVARSTPETKYKIVKALKELGEVVAVTGDGVNDAPAIKNADIGIAMGDGSAITKESADIVLLNNSFSVIVKAIAFGRNIYRNFQRFIFFKLTVNFSAVAVIIVFLLLGFERPFSALQLLWINIIMDGPLALSLGIEVRDNEYMKDKPVKRNASIVSKSTFIRTVIHSIIIAITIIAQKNYNFMGVTLQERSSVIFSLFVFFQLFNAINARELGTVSVLKTFGKNKLFIALFAVTVILQVIITQFFANLFQVYPLSLLTWIKVLAVTFLIVLISEAYKFVYKLAKKQKVSAKKGFLKGRAI